MTTLPAKLANMATGLARVKSTTAAASASADMPYMKFAKGEWTYGAEEIEVQEGSVWAINPMNIAVGFVAWDQNNTAGGPIGEEMRPYTDAPIIKGELPDLSRVDEKTGLPTGLWSEQIAIQLRCMNGDDEGVQVAFKTNSKGGLRGINDFTTALLEQLEKAPDTLVAVVELGTSDYKHKKFGKVYVPVFDIQRWVSMDDLEADDAPEEPEEVVDAEPDEEPKSKATRKRRRRKVA